MVFFRRWLLIVFALLFGGGPVLAASREDNTYAAAVLAFQDKFYTLAETKLTQFLQTYRKSTNAPAAVLMLAQSEYYLKNYPAAINRLADPVNLAKAQAAGLGDRYDYWRGEAQFAQGDMSGAAGAFASMADDYPNSPLALKAAVEAAAVYARNADWSQVDLLLASTNGLFQTRARMDPANELVVNGRLLEAESKCARNDFAGAIEVLKLFKPATLKAEQNWKWAHLSYQADMGRNDPESAHMAAANMIQIAQHGHGDVWATNLAESVACQAGVFEHQDKLAEAAETWRINLGANVPADQQRRAILKVADLAAAQGKLLDAETNLEAFLDNFSGSPAAGTARLRLGELHLQEYISQPALTDQLAQAQSILEQVISAESNGPLVGKAYLDRGWCNWLEATNAMANDTNAALGACLADFSSAEQKLTPGSEDWAVARFKMGDAQFALTNYADAIKNYQAVRNGFTGLSNAAVLLRDRALHQILRARLELKDINGMNETMKPLLDDFFANGANGNSLLLAGQGLSDFGNPASARALFQRFEATCTNSPLMPEVAFALARTYAQEQNWSATVTNCESWLKAYPASELRPKIEYVRAWAVSQTGDAAEAFVLFTNFLNQYTNLPELTPLARWAVADYYFQLGTNFEAADYQYQLISQDFPNSKLAGPAQLMAARAVMGRAMYPQAIHTYLEPLINNVNTAGELRDKARFAYCEALREISKSETNNDSLVEATKVLAQMYPETATNIAGALAWCETGDCDLLLGAFDAATNAYTQAMGAPTANLELRNRAQVGLGNVFRKKADWLAPEAKPPLLSLALQSYMNVIINTNDAANPYWMKEAALQALPLMAVVKEGEINNFISLLEYWLPQLKDTLDKKRLE